MRTFIGRWTALFLAVLALFLPALLPALGASPVQKTAVPYMLRASSPLPSWLTRVNAYRAQAGLPPVEYDLMWSRDAWYHARYMVKEDQVGHSEDPSSPWYTPQGNRAAGVSNVFVSTQVNTRDVHAIDWWMTAPFHAAAILEPRVTKMGFGSYREPVGMWRYGAVLDVLDGVDYHRLEGFPVRWPGPHVTVSLHRFAGGEFPDPLAACPGYHPPTGLPILFLLRPNVVPAVGRYAVETQGAKLDTCLITPTTYQHPDPRTRDLVRTIMRYHGMIILIPRSPLRARATYTVSLEVNGTHYRWTFRVADQG